MPLSAETAAAYLKAYVERYRAEYRRFVSPPPKGGGFPPLRISPYLYSTELTCYLAGDGAILADFSWQPPYDWHVAGGPALMVDLPETRTPGEVVDQLKRAGLWGKDIGLYRMVFKGPVTEDVWRGALPAPTETAESIAEGGTRVRVSRLDLDLRTLVERLTYGAFGAILDLKLPGPESEFWNPRIVRNLGFVTADRVNRRFFHYLEILSHSEEAAWDTRELWARVHVDVQRDFANAVSEAGRPGGTISLGKAEAEVQPFYDRLSALKQAADEFERLLDERGDADEAVFHEFLKNHPALIDVYGRAVSKPRFHYPPGESPLGKEFVEPDFIIQYPGNSYRLVELERPAKRVATKAGQSSADVGQAAFQTAEWKTYIQKHYDLIKGEFPGISVNCASLIVISRATQRSFGDGRDVPQYMELVRNQYAADVFLYDDLLARAKEAFVRISALSAAK